MVLSLVLFDQALARQISKALEVAPLGWSLLVLVLDSWFALGCVWIKDLVREN